MADVERRYCKLSVVEQSFQSFLLYIIYNVFEVRRAICHDLANLCFLLHCEMAVKWGQISQCIVTLLLVTWGMRINIGFWRENERGIPQTHLFSRSCQALKRVSLLKAVDLFKIHQFGIFSYCPWVILVNFIFRILVLNLSVPLSPSHSLGCLSFSGFTT